MANIKEESDSDSPQSDDIDKDNLILLDRQAAKNTSSVKYPPGCPVWYNMDQPSSSTKRLDARHGIVKDIYIDKSTMSYVYKVIKNDNDISSEEGEQYVLEDKLSFAFNCPVKVKGLVENDPNKELEGKVMENDPNKELEGQVLFPKLSIGDKKTPYTIVFLFGGGNVRVEKGVDAELITYNPPPDEVESAMEEKTSGKIGDKNNEVDSKNDTMGGDSSSKMDTKVVNVPDVQSPASSLVKSDITEGTVRQDKPTDIIEAKIGMATAGKGGNANITEGTTRQGNSNKPSNVSTESSAPLNRPSVDSSVQHGKLERTNTASLSKEPPMFLNKPRNLQQNDSLGSAELNAASLVPGHNQTTQLSYQRLAPPPLDNNPRRKSAEHSLESKIPENESQPHALVTSRKRTSPSETDLHDRFIETKRLKSSPATLILTVPQWVTEKCTKGNELFHYLIGVNGSKTKQIDSQTNCRINLSDPPHKNTLVITIESRSCEEISSFKDVGRALTMVVGSLLEFLRDANSAGRLIYELAKTAKGTFDMNIRQAGGPVRAKCQHTGRLVWMKLLELPMAEDKGKLTPHGDFLLMPKVQAELKGGTNNCSIELYGFEGCIPELLTRTCSLAERGRTRSI